MPGHGRRCGPSWPLAREHEPRLYPFLLAAASTGARRGELLGLQWSDVDFTSRRISIRRAITSGTVTTPKNGRARTVPMPLALAEALLELLGERRRESLARGWPEVPVWLFCSETGGAPEERNLERVWFRLRRRAQRSGIRPLRLHSFRHYYATEALRAGKSLRWVAAVLGHSSPNVTLHHYAHALPEEEIDLGFAEHSPGIAADLESGAMRLYAAPEKDEGLTRSANPSDYLVELGGLEPPTPRLPALCSPS